MEKIDLSTHSRKIQDVYDKVVRGDPSTNYAVFTVDKDGTLNASASGPGGLDDFVEEFTDGHVQFGLVRVTVPGSDVFKNILLGWCPDNAPVKLRMSFAANFADVARVLSGYHIQITARDADDLDVDEFVARVGAAAGARYTAHTSTAAPTTAKPAFKPTPAAKPASKPSSFVPKSTGKPIAPAAPKPAFSKPAKAPPAAKPETDDGWGDEKEIQERDFEKQPLEDVPSAYKPTTVNIAELRKQKSDTISSPNKSTPKPQDEAPAKEEPKSLSDRASAFLSSDGRLTSLPKPKVSHSVASRYTSSEPAALKPSFGAKPSLPGAKPKKELPEGVFQIHGNENGLTPAQAWALKKGKYKLDFPADDDKVSAETAALSLGSEKNGDAEEEAEEEEEEEEEPEPKKFVPTIIKPATGGFAPPPKRNVPVVTPPEKEEEEEEEEEEEAPAPAPAPAALPARSLPPLPTRTESAAEVPVAAPAKAEAAGTSAIAQYDYEKDEDNEVAFEEGDLIVEIEFVDDEWWSGKNSRTGEAGLFPGSYVTVQEGKAEAKSAPEPAARSEPVAEPETAAQPEPVAAGKKAVAEYDYEKDEDNEIAFAEGDLIVEIDFVDEDWWSGKHSVTGEVGLFPANYVKLQ